MNQAWQDTLDHFLSMDVGRVAEVIGGTMEDAQYVISRVKDWKERDLTPQQIIDGLMERLLAAAAGQSSSVN